MTTEVLAVVVGAALVLGAVVLFALERRRYRRNRDRHLKLQTLGEPHSLEEWKARAAASQARSDARR